MSTKTALFLVGLFGAISTVPNKTFWRDFDGGIPDDAILAGTRNGENLYIGQVYFIERYGVGSLPAELHQGDNFVLLAIESEFSSEFNPVANSNKNVQILCGSPDDVSWATLSNTDPIDDILATLIRGGYEQSFGEKYDYIGRTTTQDFIGRAIYDNIQNQTGLILNYLNNGTIVTVFEEFQVLVSV